MNIFSALLITGIILIYLDKKLEKPEKEIEYRYLPRTLNHYMEDAAFSTDDILQTMQDDSGNIWLKMNKELK